MKLPHALVSGIIAATLLTAGALLSVPNATSTPSATSSPFDHPTGATATAQKATPMTATQFRSIDGKIIDLRDFSGKPVLVVNTASMCGFTPQYDGLQKLWTSYKAQGLTVIGVPSNDFGGQEPKSEGEIKTFCELKFNVDFPLTARTKVKGNDAHPFFVWARDTLGADGTPRWNFHKILIGRNGQPIAGFGSSVAPNDPAMLAAIKAEL